VEKIDPPVQRICPPPIDETLTPTHHRSAVPSDDYPLTNQQKLDILAKKSGFIYG
jgi:hypothetical protein